MSREIKFRAWDTVTKEMYSHEQLCDPAGDGTSLTYKEFSEFGENGATVMQFTGLRDKNGKEIYGGDVLRVEPNQILMTVTYRGSKFQAIDKYSFPWDIESALSLSGEVIGNIYENPELIA